MFDQLDATFMPGSRSNDRRRVSRDERPVLSKQLQVL